MIKEKFIKLKKQPKWVARTMFGMGAVLGLGLALHMLPISGSRADNEIAPSNYIHEVEVDEINTITICDPNDSTACITMMDRNLGAENNDINSTGSWGYHYQWGNNHGFLSCYTSGCNTWYGGDGKTGIQVDASSYGPENGYSGGNFIYGFVDWSSVKNDNLRGGSGDSAENNRGYDIINHVAINVTDRQGPCPDGYHVPSIGEWNKILEYRGAHYTGAGNDLEVQKSGGLLISISSGAKVFKLPVAGLRQYENGAFSNVTLIWSSSPAEDYAIDLYVGNNNIVIMYNHNGYYGNPRAYGGSLRCFKNEPITFHQINFYNGIGLIWSGDVVSGNTASGIKPEDPTRTGFIFAGWYETGTTEPFDFDTPITEDLNLYAMWTEITNHVNFINGENIIDSGDVVSGNTASGIKPENPTRTGFSFAGWYKTGATEPFDFNTPITENLDLYAGWIEVYQVNFIVSGNIYATGNVVSGNTASGIKPEDPTRTGFSFAGWYESGDNTPFDFNTTITGNLDLYAGWTDETIPTCDVIYSTTGATTGNVIATLTGCSETITGTDTQYTFTGNGTYIFNFQDLVGNTGSTTATVTWIATHIDTEGNIFTWRDLTICNPYDSRECITMMDRNLGATTNNINNTGSYGYKYQWGNNYGFKDGCWITTGCSDNVTSGASSVYTNGANWSNDYNNNGYYGEVFIKGGINTYWSDYKVHNQLWGGGNDWMMNNWGYPTINPTYRQGPCPEGYHVPSAGELSKVVGRWIEQSDTGLRAQGYKDTVSSGMSLNWIHDHSGSYAFLVDFNIPLAGIRGYYNGNLGGFGDHTSLWTSTAPGNETIVVSYYLDGKYNVEPGYRSSSWNHGTSDALPIRCFKNNSLYDSGDTLITFPISIDNTPSAGGFLDFSVKAIKDNQPYRDYTGKIIITLTDTHGYPISSNSYEIYNNGMYTFIPSDRGNKTFKNWLKINKAGTYKLRVYDSSEKNFVGSEIFVVKSGHSSSDFKYDTLRFNPYFPEEMNKAFQYSHYYGITTKNTIREADMYSGLTRVAMAKMLTKYAKNVLGINNFNTSRNCTFNDVPKSLDKDYDYGVTKACQLGIMGVNMPDNKFYPNGLVTRAEFATALSRLLYNTKDGATEYYSTHISKLYREGIITNTDPTLQELRGYVMLMLKRASEK